jgi:hypothetical protein
MKFNKEIPLNNNKVLNAIWNGFNPVITKIQNEIANFDIANWLDGVIYDAKILELSAYHNEVIKGNVLTILKAYKNIGTYEAYEILIKSLVGDSAIIEFENPAPAILNVNITSDFGELYMYQKNTEEGIDTINNENILLKGVAKVLNRNEIIKLLEKLVPVGILVNFKLN